MNLKILFFGQLADITGTQEMEIMNVKDSDSLQNKLSDEFPEMKGLQFSVAVNNKTVTENTILKDGDIVAILPPFSGG